MVAITEKCLTKYKAELHWLQSLDRDVSNASLDLIDIPFLNNVAAVWTDLWMHLTDLKKFFICFIKICYFFFYLTHLSSCHLFKLKFTLFLLRSDLHQSEGLGWLTTDAMEGSKYTSDMHCAGKRELREKLKAISCLGLTLEWERCTIFPLLWLSWLQVINKVSQAVTF